jgi:hypothetical protein
MWLCLTFAFAGIFVVELLHCILRDWRPGLLVTGVKLF